MWVGCGEESSGPSGSAETARPSAAAAKTFARSARLTAGNRNRRLVSIPNVGRLLVSCGRDGGSASFAAHRLLPTADVVVQRGAQSAAGSLDPEERFSPSLGPVRRGVEQWQIAGFAKAQAPVATISVSYRRLSEPHFACAISAHASLFRSAAGTLTR